jgi:REP-associated tyrosine transposase
MNDYRTSSHSKYSLHVHVVWVTKYRKKVLTGEIALSARNKIREICKRNDVEIIKGHVSTDHVHLLVSMPPHVSVSKMMKYIKGASSRKLLQEYKGLNKTFWGRHLWARGYFAVSSGNVTDEVIKMYIENQDKETDDDFRISEA